MRNGRLPQVRTWAGSARCYSSFVAIKKGEDAAWTAAVQHRKQVIELHEGRRRQIFRDNHMWEAMMLSEKFFLVLETLRSHSPQDGSTRVVSASRHVPIKLPEKTEKPRTE